MADQDLLTSYYAQTLRVGGLLGGGMTQLMMLEIAECQAYLLIGRTQSKRI